MNNFSSSSSNKGFSTLNFEDLFYYYDETEQFQNKSLNSKELYDNSDNGLSNIKNDTTESKLYIQGVSYSIENYELLKTIIYEMIYCKICKNPFIIIFNDNLRISFECECSLIQNISIEEFIRECIRKEIFYSKNGKYLMHCKFHNVQTKFVKYCIICEYDICEKCINDKYFFINDI